MVYALLGVMPLAQTMLLIEPLDQNLSQSASYFGRICFINVSGHNYSGHSWAATQS